MKNNNLHTPILVTGVPRSGSTFIARILHMSGGYVGDISKMYENFVITKINEDLLEKADTPLILPETRELRTFNDFELKILKSLQNSQETSLKWLYKSSTLTLLWRVWANAFPNAQWIIVRRKTPDIINSCQKTGYMTLMECEHNLKLAGAKNTEEGWRWLIHQYETRWMKMMSAQLNIKEVWPDRMEEGNFEQVKEIVESCGLEWNSKIQETIQPIIIKRKGNK